MTEVLPPRLLSAISKQKTRQLITGGFGVRAEQGLAQGASVPFGPSTSGSILRAGRPARVLRLK